MSTTNQKELESASAAEQGPLDPTAQDLVDAHVARLATEATGAAGPNICQRLSAIVGEVVPVAARGRAAAAIGGFAYPTAEDVEDILRPLLAKHGVLAWPVITGREIEAHEVEGSNNRPTLQYDCTLDVDVEFINVDAPADRMVFSTFGHTVDKGSAAPAKALTSALKHAYLAIFHMKGQPDAEASTAEPRPPKPNAAADKKLHQLTALCKKHTIPTDTAVEICRDAFDGREPRELAPHEVDKLMKVLKAEVEPEAKAS